MLSDKAIDLQDISPIVILLIGLFVTGIALLESWKGWIYAPFPIAHALLALLIPARCKCLHLGNTWRELRSHIRLLITMVIAALLFIGGYVLIYSLFLNGVGKTSDPNWNLLATYKFLGHLYINRYNRTTVLLIGYLLVGIWPMFGEEFFYRGFLFKGLKNHTSTTIAAIISSFLFGLRHSFQLIYLLPVYPFVSGIAYFVWAAGFGLLWVWTYHRSQSLWPCIVTHSANLLLAPVIFIILRP